MDLTLLTNMCQFFRPKTITRKEVTPPLVFFFFFPSKYLIADWREREREIGEHNEHEPNEQTNFPQQIKLDEQTN